MFTIFFVYILFFQMKFKNMLMRCGFFLTRRLPHQGYRCLSSKGTFQNLNHFGLLQYNCPKISAIIQSVNPHNVPNGDMAFIDLIDNESQQILQHHDIHTFLDASYCSKSNILSISENEQKLSSLNTSLLIQIPHNYDIHAITSNIFVKESEGTELKIITDGNCKLGKISSQNIDIVCKGTLDCKSLLGNGSCSIRHNATFGKIQSNHLIIETRDGNLDVSSCYCPQLQCQSENGSIKIGDLHGSSDLKTTSGSLSVSALAGSSNVQTQSGNVDITVDSCGYVFIESEQGNISVGLSDSVSAYIESTGTFVDVPQDLLVDGMKREMSTGVQHFDGKLGSSSDNAITAKSLHGCIDFSRKSWFSKFNVELD